MRTIWNFLDEAGGAATNVTSQNGSGYPFCSRRIYGVETSNGILVKGHEPGDAVFAELHNPFRLRIC
jgi:hypothetical protein